MRERPTRRVAMESIQISLKDNDQKVRTKVLLNGQEDLFKRFLRQVNEEIIIGETAYLEIEGVEKGLLTFEISHLE